MIKNCMQDMLKKLGQNFDAFAGTLRTMERTEEGDFIVPAEVMLSIVNHVQELFGTVRKTHVTVQTVLEQEHISREKAWDMLIEDTDTGTEH